MSVAWELDVQGQECRPWLYALPEPRTEQRAERRPERPCGHVLAQSVSGGRRVGVVVAVAVVALLVLLALPIRSLGGSSLAQATPSQGQEYVVKAGDTLVSIARQADPAHAASLAGRLAAETGGTTVVPGEHLFIP